MNLTYIKENQLKLLAGAISTISVIVGSVIAVESRYVHAGDIEKFKVEQNRAIQQQSVQSQVSVNELRKQMLEDKIFEIQLIPPQRRTDVDRARLDKYSRDLDQVNKRNLEIRGIQ